jgi:GNAT superfamily N-acetyltransferase
MNIFKLDPTVMNSLMSDMSVAYTPANIIIRPIERDDTDLVMEMHQRLSRDSIYKRYHSPRMPTRREVAEMCALDGKNGRAFVAVIPGYQPQIVGIAYYIMSGQKTAEAAFLVEDSYQGQGIGKRLIKHLRREAIRQGICFFDAYVLPTNSVPFHLLNSIGRLITSRLSYGTREMRVQIGCMA